MSTASETLNLARIRDNQRRSRARRKEYLEELETRLRSCELQGVEASTEIQTAARKVAEENRKLRALLARIGIGHDKLKIYLTTSPGVEEITSVHFGPLTGESVQVLEEALKPRQGRCTDTPLDESSMRRRDSSVSTTQSLWDSAKLPPGDPPSSMMQTRAPVMAPTSMACPPSSNDPNSHHSLPRIQERPAPRGQQQGPRNLSPASTLATGKLDDNFQNSLQNSSYNMPPHFTAQNHLQLYNAPQRPSEYVQPSAPIRNVNNCSHATDMITTMVGADPNAIRTELGCLPDMDCDVDNQLVFDVMDRYSNGVGL